MNNYQKQDTVCSYCNVVHQTKCPLVKSIEYYEDGIVKKVEFMLPSDYQTIPNVNYYVYKKDLE